MSESEPVAPTTELLRLAARVACREYLPTLESCRTIRDARDLIERFDAMHADLAMELKKVLDKFEQASVSPPKWEPVKDAKGQIVGFDPRAVSPPVKDAQPDCWQPLPDIPSMPGDPEWKRLRLTAWEDRALKAEKELLDAAMLLRRWAHKYVDTPLAKQTVDWLKRKNLQGSILRDETDTPNA